MRTCFQSKTVVVIALLIGITIIITNWMGASHTASICAQVDEACQLQNQPAKGSIIWDEITRGLLSTFAI